MEVSCPRYTYPNPPCEGTVEVEVTQDTDGDGVWATPVLNAVSDDKCSEGHELTEEEQDKCADLACEKWYENG